MKVIAYNQQMIDVVKADLQYLFEQYGRLNVSYEKASKEKTYRQMGFVFAALINGITDYFVSCGFNVDDEDVRYALYDQVSQIVPEMVVDKQIFGGKSRVKHISEMDRALMSKFIDGVFEVLNTNPMYAGIKLHPYVYYNWLWHLDPEEVRWVGQHYIPERDEKYLDYVRSQPCICCGIQHRSHAHHAKIPKYVSNSKKTPDWTAIPLCQQCHLEGAHQKGHEWLMKQLEWLPYEFETVCRLNYARWKNNKE